MKAVLLRDLRLATRSGGGIGLALVFFAIVVVLTPFAIGPEMGLLREVAAGILWLGALLACLLSLDRIFALDFEDGTLEHLALAPVPLEAVVLAKGVAHWLTTGVPLVVFAAPLGILLNLPPDAYGPLVLSLAIGTPALSLVGAFGAALTVGVKRGGLLLSLLVLPLYVPTLILGAEVARRAGQGMSYETALGLQGALTLLAVALLPFAAAAALRINLR